MLGATCGEYFFYFFIFYFFSNEHPTNSHPKGALSRGVDMVTSTIMCLHQEYFHRSCYKRLRSETRKPSTGVDILWQLKI